MSNSGSKRKKYDYDVAGKTILVVDAREAGEPISYVFKATESMPRHMQHQLSRKNKYEFVYFDDGAEGTDGLVNPESENADQRAEEVSEYIDAFLLDTNKLPIPFTDTIDFYISLASM